ncbi:MAG TPA: sialidase family protein [Candidatus Hydrogenedentes bacterium]|nr:sialidase family protein [Candidatus Hydrogenedentota bacterium]HQM50318.1 sialidase family protein [Candidatus Hydrogenedentota bacterium]
MTRMQPVYVRVLLGCVLSACMALSRTVASAGDIEAIREQPAASILGSETIWGPAEIYIGWPTIAKTREGELLVAFSGDRDAHICPWGKTQLVRSSDNGATWTPAETVNNTPLDDRDAGIIQTRQGTLVVSWFTSLAFERNDQYRRHREKLSAETVNQWFGSWIRRSEDDGKTWGSYIRVETSAPHGPIELSDGRLLYVGCTGANTPEERVGVLESRDDGRTWTRIGSIAQAEGDDPSQCHEPHVAETAGGALVAMARYHGEGEFANHLRQAFSTDGGKTWTRFEPTPIWGYPPHLLRLDNGWLLVTYGRRTEPFGERACISKDDGKTWDVQSEIVLSQAPSSDLGYPASAQLGDGSILTVYYEVLEKGRKPPLRYTHWKLK